MCKKQSEHSIITSIYKSGYPDLDTRPPEMERSTIDYRVHRCPHCGYCARDISEGSDNVIEIVNSEDYKEQMHSDEFPELANSFLCASIIQEEAGDLRKVFLKIIHAAWVCDDVPDEEAAKKCRLRAIEIIEKAEKDEKRFAYDRESEAVVFVDLLRRAGKFDRAINIINAFSEKIEDKMILNILKFQRKLILQKNIDKHTLDMSFGNIT